MTVRLSFFISRAIGKWHARQMSCEFPLLELPTELIALILAHVDRRSDLCSVASTCQRLQILAETVLYQEMTLRIRPAIERVVAAFAAREERAASLRVLHVPCKPRVGTDFAALATLLSKAQNLRELTFESPECNSGRFESEDEWREMTDHLFQPLGFSQAGTLAESPLQKLTKVTLNMNGGASPYWSFDARSLPLLLHATLRELRISCVNLVRPFTWSDEVQCSTPLKQLYLIECNVTPKALASLLVLPKALQHLHLGENCFNVREFAKDIHPSCNHLFERNPGAVLAALSHQKHSLHSLTYATTDVYYQHRQFLRAAHRIAPVHGGFADFAKLEHVRLIGTCPNFERAVMSSRPPPNLLTLHYQGHFDVPLEFRGNGATTAPFLRAPSAISPPSLTHLGITIDAAFFHGDISLSDDARTLICKEHRACSKLDILMQVFYKPYTRFFPPILYGESESEAELIYSGSDEFLGRFAWEDITSDEDASDQEDCHVR